MSRFHRFQIKWILKNKIPIPCDNLLEWGRWMEMGERHVAKTDIDETVTMSTVFLGLDHQFSNDPEAPPILFETMVFGEEKALPYRNALLVIRETLDGFGRYSTYAEAQKGHEEICDLVRERFAKAALDFTPRGDSSGGGK